MTDIIGVLGEASGVTASTHTAYTVPAAKAARCRIIYRGAAGTNSTLEITVNGVTVLNSGALTAGNISYTSSDKMHNTGAASAISGGTDATTVAPGPREYYLSTGDTITYTIGTAAFSSMAFQIVGTEIDV